MFVNAKRMAFLGLLLACTTILVILSGILEFNTIFLLAAASFGVGIAIRESGIRLGFGFYVASILISFILAPNKLYCITYGAMALYVFLIEFAWEKLANIKRQINRNLTFWVIKYVCFNVMYLPIIILFPKLIYPGEIKPIFFAGIILGGQVFLYVYDRAYEYFQKSIWGKFRGRFTL